MPGTLTITTLSDGTNSTSTTNCIQGSAKAWVNFSGTTAAIAASYNVSSVVRNSVGNYTVNFTNSFADAKYSAVQTNVNTAAGAVAQVYSQAAGSCVLLCYNTVGTFFDTTTVSATFNR